VNTASPIRSVSQRNPFLGNSFAIRELSGIVMRLLSTESPILIEGETGTGKGVLATWLHQNSPRRDKPLVHLNCAALPKELLESELFGHEKGAFTGAVAVKVGLFEAADHGTLFLDEIGDMDLHVQPKLLNMLEEKRFRRLGAVQDQTVDVRLIAATHRDLSALLRDGQLRSDLYFRISTWRLRVPPLRERTEDIPILARLILDELDVQYGSGSLTFSPDFEQALQSYHWPGNIRELRNVLERAVLLCDDKVLTFKNLHLEHPSSETAPGGSDKILTLLEVERRHIQKVLQIERGQVEGAAKRLGLSRSALYEKIKKYGIRLSRNPES
jgi:transcriptional regulator with GAF, ATPase, and Fis domain